MSIKENLLNIKASLPDNVTLVAVSKTKSVEEIKSLYDEGQRIFGENKVQELLLKKPLLPSDIEWHMIGNLQTNKIKQILPHTALIHSVSSFKLLQEIEKQSTNLNICSRILLQVHIAKEESKSGFSFSEIEGYFSSGDFKNLKNTSIHGLMGMATFTDNQQIVKKEFSELRELFDKISSNYFDQNPSFSTLSMGMSGDYKLAIECGSNMVRIGSLLFGER